MRWISSVGPLPVRDVEDPHVTTDERRELPCAGVVRAKRSTDAEQVRAKPERVAALDGPGRLDPAGRGDPGGPRPGLERVGLGRPVGLAGPKRDGTAIGHQQRIEGVHEVGAVELRVEDVDTRAERRERRHEGVMLAARELEVDRMDGIRGPGRRTRRRRPARDA